MTHLTCGAASQTEKMIIDPPLFADLPVQVNGSPKKLSISFSVFDSSLQCIEVQEHNIKSLFEENFVSLQKLFHLLSYYNYWRTNVRNPLLALNFTTWTCWCLNTNSRKKCRKRVSIQAHFYYILLSVVSKLRTSKASNYISGFIFPLMVFFKNLFQDCVKSSFENA